MSRKRRYAYRKKEIIERNDGAIIGNENKLIVSSRLLSKNLIIKIYDNNIASCAVWLWNMVSYIKGGMQAKGIWK